jgi:hypothetical protein
MRSRRAAASPRSTHVGTSALVPSKTVKALCPVSDGRLGSVVPETASFSTNFIGANIGYASSGQARRCVAFDAAATNFKTIGPPRFAESRRLRPARQPTERRSVTCRPVYRAPVLHEVERQKSKEACVEAAVSCCVICQMRIIKRDSADMSEHRVGELFAILELSKSPRRRKAARDELDGRLGIRHPTRLLVGALWLAAILAAGAAIIFCCTRLAITTKLDHQACQARRCGIGSSAGRQSAQKNAPAATGARYWLRRSNIRIEYARIVRAFEPEQLTPRRAPDGGLSPRFGCAARPRGA